MEDKRACLGVGSPFYLHMYPRDKIQNSKQVKQVPLPTEPSILPQITFVYLLSIISLKLKSSWQKLSSTDNNLFVLPSCPLLLHQASKLHKVDMIRFPWTTKVTLCNESVPTEHGCDYIWVISPVEIPCNHGEDFLA